MKFYDWCAEDIQIEHRPITCPTCGEPLTGNDDDPLRHQIIELPQLRPSITEHRVKGVPVVHSDETRRDWHGAVGLSENVI